MKKTMKKNKYSSHALTALLTLASQPILGYSQTVTDVPVNTDEKKAPFTAEMITSEAFYKNIEKFAPWIKKSTQWNPSTLLTEIERKGANWNKYFQKSESTISTNDYPYSPFESEKDYQLDLAELKKATNAADYIDAKEKCMSEFKFNESEGTFKYPYSTLKYWDIPPHPPVESLNEDLSKYSAIYGKEETDSSLLKLNAQTEIDEATNTELSTGNSVNMLNNSEVYQSLVKNMSEAKEDVLASNMFMTCDPSLEKLLDVMSDKISKGVKITIIFDRIFTLKYSKCFKKLKRLGVQVNYSNDFFKFGKQMVYHNKFWVFDGKKAVVYGPNLLDAQVNASGFNGLYRDSGVELEGPVVNDLVVGYGKLLKYFRPKHFKRIQARVESAEKLILTERENKLRGSKTLTENGTKNIPDSSCRAVLQTRDHKYNMTELYKAIIKNTDRNLYISRMQLNDEIENSEKMMDIYSGILEKIKNPEFHVDVTGNNWMTATDVKSGNYKEKDFLSKLYRLFVKVDDQRASILDIRNKTQSETGSNFKVWHYFQYYHQKTMLADNLLSVIGSFNVNNVSTDKSFEMGVVCVDKKLNQQMKKSIVLDLLNSIPLKAGKSE